MSKAYVMVPTQGERKDEKGWESLCQKYEILGAMTACPEHVSIQASFDFTQRPAALTATGALVRVHQPGSRDGTRETGPEIRRLSEDICN